MLYMLSSQLLHIYDTIPNSACTAWVEDSAGSDHTETSLEVVSKRLQTLYGSM